MKLLFKLWAAMLLLSCSGVAQAPADSANPVALRAVVDELEDAFLARLETTGEPEKVFDDYEARIKELIAQSPDRPEPFVGLMELFEKCGAARSRRLLEENLSRTNLPAKIRVAYEQTKKTLDLIGMPVGLGFTALDGRPVRFEDLQGKVVIVDFWATWCGPCVRDLPKLQALYAKYQQAGLTVVGVSFDRERAKLDSFLKANVMPWRQIYPDAAEREVLAKKLGVTGGYLPMVFIIGRDGLLRHTLDSRFRTEEKVAALLKE